MSITRTFDLLDRYRSIYFDKTDAIAGKKDGQWVRYSSQDYIEKTNELSAGFMALGIKPGNKVATIINNRPEWNFVDMALAQIGAVHVPIYPTISTEEYEYILNHSEARLVIISGKLIYNKIEPILGQVSQLKEVYTIEPHNGLKQLDQIFDLGNKNRERYKDKIVETKRNIDEESIVTLIYTSGTTGRPKGVMLTHKNLITNAIATTQAHHLGSTHRALSFLPLCHVYERMMNYHFQYKGISIYYAENLGAIAKNIKEIKPHIFNTVPRLLEKVYDNIVEKGEKLPGPQRSIFKWALALGLRYNLYANNPVYNAQLKLARKLVFSKWIDGLGGEIEAIVSGGAALHPRLARIFWAAGIPVAEGYGLTETAPVIAVNFLRKPHVKFGTVGRILDGVQAKISHDGEILCKGPNVMKGYYKDPEMTREVIDEDGWFHTGDVGIIDDDGFLTITDRKKEMFKTSAGKYIAPQVIENKLKASPLIVQAMVVGENEKFASAIISPNFISLHSWAAKKKIHFHDNKELVQHPKVQQLFQKEINELNKNLGDHEKVKRFRLVCEEWIPSRELSPTLKLKRTYLYEKYSDMLESIYGHPHQPHLKNQSTRQDTASDTPSKSGGINTKQLKSTLSKMKIKVKPGSKRSE